MAMFEAVLVVGVACLVMAAIVALARPFERWKPVAIRLSVFGAVLAVGSFIVMLAAGGLGG
ncbi:MAG: hypothetical protein JOZ87_39740 [Chloroflexi bacterium]|nr:hypothetical protein [Chloroflexota bacterium]